MPWQPGIDQNKTSGVEGPPRAAPMNTSKLTRSDRSVRSCSRMLSSGGKASVTDNLAVLRCVPWDNV